MSRPFFPGPDRLKPCKAPGGLVIHIYSVPAGELLHISLALPGDDIEAIAIQGAELVNDIAGTDADICLVVFDGDTGVRVRGTELADIVSAALGIDTGPKP